MIDPVARLVGPGALGVGGGRAQTGAAAAAAREFVSHIPQSCLRVLDWTYDYTSSPFKGAAPGLPRHHHRQPRRLQQRLSLDRPAARPTVRPAGRRRPRGRSDPILSAAQCKATILDIISRVQKQRSRSGVPSFRSSEKDRSKQAPRRICVDHVKRDLVVVVSVRALHSICGRCNGAEQAGSTPQRRPLGSPASRSGWSPRTPVQPLQ